MAATASPTTTKLSSISSSHRNSSINPAPRTHLSILPKTLSKPSCFPQKHFLSHTHRNSFAIRSKNPIFDLVSTKKNDPDGAFSFSEDDDKPREECGVVGIYGDPEASRLCYLALHALQHRGQEGAGIVSVSDNVLHSITGVGLVSDVFNESKLDQLPGEMAIGHVRYSTAGASMLKNVQPFVAGYRFGSVGVAHNGNLVNYRKLRAMLEDNGSIFNTSSDTEVVLHLIAISKVRPFFLRIVDACEKLEGAYSMVFATEDKLVAVRDPYGFRPLVMGRRSNGAVVFASETCALDLIEATYEREVSPGEVVAVDKDGVQSLCLMPHLEPKQCIFEHIYFSLPNSIIFGRSVYESRHAFGEILATEAPVDCDVVIAVPDSGVVAALGYAAKSGVPFQQGLIRSHYVGRTFIEPSQKIRDFGVKLKLSPVRGVLEGKRVVVVDDSIVRGTTSSKIVRLIKEAGAKEVHMRIASPPIIASCYYGVDTPSSEELISNRMSVEEIRVYIGCDSLAFLPMDSLKRLLGKDSPSFCYACFSGNYPVLPKEDKVKRVGNFIDDGLNGSVEFIDGGWVQGPHQQSDSEGEVQKLSFL
ncbi:GLN phosphoribosyl pyrophosphate amidotransferase 1 [Tripterygium wilfordii]|uniref:amidophosphoribosyltransferase n=1 Tax=Tripterygium wilfordii TaxID=458696 RepID=A0A7J7BZA7_TRIWF|nr:amidophosphoribosyltransferase, chloroplastic-like [Tripterygium wilfordii]KAF5727178.1 GLN phosphoribosyl pyrophosphate amidotransferase 1 [Tripterygium wilfordii]